MPKVSKCVVMADQFIKHKLTLVFSFLFSLCDLPKKYMSGDTGVGKETRKYFKLSEVEASVT